MLAAQYGNMFSRLEGHSASIVHFEGLVIVSSKAVDAHVGKEGKANL